MTPSDRQVRGEDFSTRSLVFDLLVCEWFSYEKE